MIFTGGSPGGGDEEGIGGVVAGAQEAAADVADRVFAAVGLHLDILVGAEEKIVLEGGLHTGTEIGDPVTACDNTIAHGYIDISVLVVAGVHRVCASRGIVVNRHVDNFKGIPVVDPIDDQSRPGTVSAHSVSGAVNQAILHLAAAAPELDPVARVVGHNTMVNGGIGRFGV